MELADFIDYVQLDFARQDSEDKIIQAYNDMIVWVAAQMPNSNYKFQSYVTTSIGIEDYPLPTNLLHLIHPVRLLLGTGASDEGYTLNKLTKEEYDNFEPNPNRSSPSTGRPSAYTVFSRCILLTPVPDLATYILEINWAKRPTAQSADADTTSLGTEWDEVLKYGTMERLHEGLGLYDEAQYWGSKYHMRVGYDDVPVGLCRKLLEIEKSIEGNEVGCIRNNNL